MTASSIPTLALLGTCLGFFVAIGRVASAELGSGDPLALLDSLMDGGVATALATTVVGQALYLALGQAWSLWVASSYERAKVELDEAIALLRPRIGGTP